MAIEATRYLRATGASVISIQEGGIACHQPEDHGQH
jgi:hypothetical protein